MTETLRPEDFPFPFRDDQRAIAARFVENGQAELKATGSMALWRVRIKIFKRTLEAWAERDQKTGKLRFACECPHIENTGEGCAHLFTLCLLIEQQLSLSAAGDEPTDPIALWWLLERDRSMGRRSASFQPALRGDDGTFAPVRITSEVLSRAFGDEDRLLKLFAPSGGGRLPLDRGGGFAKPDGPFPLEDDALAAAIDLLLRSGRLFLRRADGTTNGPITAESPLPFQLVMSIERPAADEPPEAHPLRGVLVRGSERVRTRDADLVVVGRRPFVVHQGRFGWLETFDASDWLGYLLKKDGPPVPVNDVTAFLERIAAGGALPRLQLPGDPEPIPVETGIPEPVLAVTRDRQDVVATLAFRYAGQLLRTIGSQSLILDAPNKRQLTRDLKAEEAAFAAVRDAGAVEDPDQYGRLLPPTDKLDVFAATLIGKGFTVLVDGKPRRTATSKTVNLKSGMDWFEVGGAVTFGTEVVPLTVVFDALRRGKRFVELKDGSEGMLPEQWANRWRILDDLGERRQNTLRFNRSHALFLEAVIGDGDDGVEASPEALEKLHGTLRSLTDRPRTAAPKTFTGELRTYQQEGVDWIAALAKAGFGGCLADDMGLGKTVQVIAWLSLRAAQKPGAPTLIVVPRSLVFNWQREFQRFAPKLRVLDYSGIERAGDRSTFDSVDVVITTYGILRRDIDVLEKVRFDWAILDESQAIKNSASQNAKAACRLVAANRLAMTGTPIENRAEELWSQFRFLNPGLLGTEADFGRLARSTETRPVLARIVRPLILRRTKEQVATELPPRIEQVIYCELSPEQATLYRTIADAARSNLGPKLAADAGGAVKLQVLEALLRLRQVACHAGLVDKANEQAPSGKLEVLVDEIEEVVSSGHKALIFSQFVSLLTHVRRFLDATKVPYAYLDGQTRDREAQVQRFQQDPETQLFLVSLMAGGHGLNITAADYVFILDPWWNPAVEAQAIARAHRIGRKETVVAIRLVARGTVEERILELQERKRSLADALLEQGDAAFRDLSVEDLMLLFA